MKYGYARVLPGGKSESVEAQVRQLTKAGCKKVFRDVHVSRAKADRPIQRQDDQPPRCLYLDPDCLLFVEIGDETQIATVGLAARFEVFCAVVAGTTLGMMLANVPAVILGDRLADKLPVKAIRMAAAVLFGLLGVLTLSSLRL